MTPTQIRQASTTVVAVLSLLTAACTGPFWERSPPENAVIVNQTDRNIWLAAERLGERMTFLIVNSKDQGVVCAVQPSSIYVYPADPVVNPDVDHVAVLDLGETDFCDGIYIWDGTTLIRTE